MSVSNGKIYPVTPAQTQRAHLDRAQYDSLYRESIESPQTFWPRMATDFLSWLAPFTKLNEVDMKQGHTAWFIGEFGVALVPFTVAVAWYCWHHPPGEKNARVID